MRPKFGIIGCGNISRFHFNGLEKAGADIVYISDIHEPAAKPYVDKYKAKYSPDYKDVIADPEVTVVSVLTSAKYHKEICLAALRAGKDVICEKTMANDGAESIEIAQAAKTSGRLFYTSYMKRFFPAVQKAKELLPQLGRLFSAQARAYQNWGDSLYELDNGDGQQWILDAYGGAVIKCAGSHMIDMTLHLLGRPDSLYAHIDYISNSRVDRKANALFEYANGMVAHYETAVHPLTRVGYERNSWDEKLEINGVNGRLEIYTILWDQPENNGALLVHYDNATESSTEYRYPSLDPFEAEMAYFHTCLTDRKQGQPDVIDGMNVDLVIEAMGISAAQRKAHIFAWPVNL
ncbi:Gfo/Idh/MocA family protein [Cohnella silvisoli]|uniref:Gfo/Idh/MocA family oxidoreductase n=1 Tax=Cohnella silvisoli TaxID=2873699 RepID=A0ABV1L0A5_9BACL|nr:Gfo/Idh/MocA family oxidoreductase [Cohnella silvisoli]MCD9024870.1 Gfo/Idh/MocA family oxidoreductase [Cohnella silvisoli]